MQKKKFYKIEQDRGDITGYIYIYIQREREVRIPSKVVTWQFDSAKVDQEEEEEEFSPDRDKR